MQKSLRVKSENVQYLNLSQNILYPYWMFRGITQSLQYNDSNLN
jgi:hypothetical protein